MYITDIYILVFMFILYYRQCSLINLLPVLIKVHNLILEYKYN